MRALFILGILLLTVGCTSKTSYRGLPAKYTDLPTSSALESYLIGITPAFGPAFAARFDFDRSGEMVLIQSFDSEGPRVPQKKSGEEAARLLSHFRTFDWNALGEERPLAIYTDDAAIVFKARKAGSYREAHGGATEHPMLYALLKSVSENLEAPNQSSQPTPQKRRG